jgi:glycosyltransferase involved in cell wall biosynthesis
MGRANQDAAWARGCELISTKHLEADKQVVEINCGQRSRSLRWAVITGEYPWQPGGVSDYTRQVAIGLAEAGDEVRVWAPANGKATPADRGVEVHRLPDHFGPRSLMLLGRALNRAHCDRVLVQYVPHAFGWKAMNVPFCLWLVSRRREAIWPMFHEVAYPAGWRQSSRHNLLAAVTRAMAALVARAAEKMFVSIAAWEPLLKRLPFGRRQPVVWLPVPSNLPVKVSDAAVAAARSRAARRPATIVGHFGTFSRPLAALLGAILPGLLTADDRRVGMLLGRGSDRFASKLAQICPRLSGRLIANDDCSTEQLAAHVAACDILMQPYIGGASGRHSSLMAGLALGRPIVTNSGPLSETLWRESEAVMLATDAAPSALVCAAEALLADDRNRAVLGARAAELYRSRFALEHTLRELRS